MRRSFKNVTLSGTVVVICFILHATQFARQRAACNFNPNTYNRYSVLLNELGSRPSACDGAMVEDIYVNMIGWAAAIMTFIAYAMKTMLPLRVAAISSNILFIVFGFTSAAMPILVLHAILLPFNCFRLAQILNLSRRIRAVRSENSVPAGMDAMLPTITAAAGKILFRRGDVADKIYILRSGLVVLEEIEAHLAPGEIFGEVAFFSETGTRTLTARCVEKCEIATMREEDFVRLYYQDPAFAFYMLRLLARRLDENITRTIE